MALFGSGTFPIKKRFSPIFHISDWCSTNTSLLKKTSMWEGQLFFQKNRIWSWKQIKRKFNFWIFLPIKFELRAIKQNTWHSCPILLSNLTNTLMNEMQTLFLRKVGLFFREDQTTSIFWLDRSTKFETQGYFSGMLPLKKVVQTNIDEWDHDRTNRAGYFEKRIESFNWNDSHRNANFDNSRKSRPLVEFPNTI